MRKKYLTLLLVFIFALGACNDPVFYTISLEQRIAEPKIGGSPTNFVVFDNVLYVASGESIYEYKNSISGRKWEKIMSQPGGKIMQLAATDNYLYALCFKDSGGNSYIRRSSSLNSSFIEWEDVKGDTRAGNTFSYDMLQSIYAANDMVFIGAERNSDYIILFMSDSDAKAGFKPLTSGGTTEAPEFMLCGVTYDSLNYYLCTRSNTIFITPKETEPDEDALVISKKVEGVTFTGIINLGINDITVAISRSGNLYYVNSLDITRVPDVSLYVEKDKKDYLSTGALTVWHDADGTPSLLLAGRQDRLDYSIDSGYTYGYMELALDQNGIIGGNFVDPGTATPSSIDTIDEGKLFKSTLGKHPVNHIFQTPEQIDPGRTLFATTQKSGVWSYRVRDGKPQWNAEE